MAAHNRKGLLLALLALAVLLFDGASISARAASPEDEQIAAIAHIIELVGAGQDSQARAAVTAARASAGSNSVLVVNALELQRTYLRAKEQYKEALPISTEVLRLRRLAKPNDHAGLGYALYEHAIITLANDRAAEADRSFLDALDAFRKAFAANDTRLAQRLEAAAEFAGSAYGFNRPQLALDLYREALDVRARAGDSGSSEKRAEILQTTAMLEMRLGERAAAGQKLVAATDLLVKALSGKQTTERRAILSSGLADMLVLRAGIAATAGDVVAADQLIEQARAVLPRARPDDALGLKISIAEVRSQIKERQGDLEGALAEVADQIDTVLKLSGDQRLLAGDVIEQYGILSLAHGDLDDAGKALDLALQLKKDEPTAVAAITIKQGELAERRGKPKEAEALYRRGLGLRKSQTSEIDILFGTNRKRTGAGIDFGADIDDKIVFGRSLILVPGGPGSQDALQDGGRGAAGDEAATAATRLVVTRTTILDPSAFAAATTAKMRAASVYAGTALVFVHGFSTRFASALARAGQIKRDIGYDGPAFVFSWPSQGRLSVDAYRSDQQRSLASVDALVSFMRTVAATTGADKIHIIAHSMGNRVLLPALAQLRQDAKLGPRLGEVVFASPDVDQDEFATRVASLKGLGMTLYASANDRALWASWFANLFSSRAGYIAHGFLSSGTPVLVDGVDSIDVSAAGQDLLNLNHDLYAANPAIATDLRRLLQKGVHPPGTRSEDMLDMRTVSGSAPFWSYRGK